MKAYKYDDKKHFESEINCQIDPLESKKAGKEIYLLPANSTFKEPLPEKEGFEVVFDGTDWVYEMIPVPPPPPQPTHNEIIYAQIYELKQKLFETDYKAIKYAEGWYSDEEYAEVKAQRETWREEIRELEAQIEPEENVNNNPIGY